LLSQTSYAAIYQGRRRLFHEALSLLCDLLDSCHADERASLMSFFFFESFFVVTFVGLCIGNQ
jgi:hypothetical protein